MGVYLSEPNKDKHFAEGTGNGFAFISAEMQGKHASRQVGGKAWKTPPSTIPTSEMATPSSQFSMDTEVLPTTLRILSQSVCRRCLHQVAHEQPKLQKW